MALIKDKKIKTCVCGKRNSVETRVAKQRVLSWMGYTMLIGFTLALITYPEFLIEDLDFKGALFLLVIGYFLVAVPYKTYLHVKEKHTLSCSLRKAMLEII